MTKNEFKEQELKLQKQVGSLNEEYHKVSKDMKENDDELVRLEKRHDRFANFLFPFSIFCLSAAVLHLVNPAGVPTLSTIGGMVTNLTVLPMTAGLAYTLKLGSKCTKLRDNGNEFDLKLMDLNMDISKCKQQLAYVQERIKNIEMGKSTDTEMAISKEQKDKEPSKEMDKTSQDFSKVQPSFLFNGDEDYGEER